jgi:uncharacterized protein (DUF2132 family)
LPPYEKNQLYSRQYEQVLSLGIATLNRIIPFSSFLAGPFMTDDISYKNNPLHGLGLKNLLIELVDQYGFELMFAYLNINCFKTNSSIESSVKFLKKTDWAREKVEAFYMYQFKSLPKAIGAQFELPPRDRIVPSHQSAGEPAELSLEHAEKQREQREKKAAEYNGGAGRRTGTGKFPGGARTSVHGGRNNSGRNNSYSSSKPSYNETPSSTDSSGPVDPWANAKR